MNRPRAVARLSGALPVVLAMLAIAALVLLPRAASSRADPPAGAAAGFVTMLVPDTPAGRQLAWSTDAAEGKTRRFAAFG